MTWTANKILLVEDDDAVREATCLALSAFGYEVDQARDGIEALEWMDRYPYPIVLADLELPRMSGLQFLSVSRLVWPSTAVVIASGMPELEEDARVRGAAAYLLKPYDRPRLLRVLEELQQLHTR